MGLLCSPSKFNALCIAVNDYYLARGVTLALLPEELKRWGNNFILPHLQGNMFLVPKGSQNFVPFTSVMSKQLTVYYDV